MGLRDAVLSLRRSRRSWQKAAFHLQIRSSKEHHVSQKNVKWLAAELPRLVQGNLISRQQQEAIIDFYTQESRSRPNVALIVFSIFGALLLAGGIILILAHNWSGLPRPTRVILSYLPLVAGQILGFWVLFKRRDSIAWSEGIAAFTFLAIGSTIALISQTYHIQGELRTYLLTWMLLAIPLVYVLRSTTSAVLYIIGISIWAIAVRVSDVSALGYWPLLLGIVPFYVQQSIGGKNLKPAAIIGWFLALSLIAGISVSQESITEGFRVITFIALFLCLFIGGELQEDNRTLVTNPFSSVGILGLSVTYLFLSYHANWEHLSYRTMDRYGHNLNPAWGDWAVCIGLPLLAIGLLTFATQRKKWNSLVMAFGLFLALIGFAFTESSTARFAFTAAFNLYVLAGGIAYMVSGIKTNTGRTVNFGFALIAAVIILRFFDSDLNFVLRGVIFVILGIGFLSTNLIIARRKAA
jgi:uncharacterized membrane protein